MGCLPGRKFSCDPDRCGYSVSGVLGAITSDTDGSGAVACGQERPEQKVGYRARAETEGLDIEEWRKLKDLQTACFPAH